MVSALSVVSSFIDSGNRRMKNSVFVICSWDEEHKFVIKKEHHRKLVN